MSKVITVVGATGIQGGSVIRAFLNTDGYTIRAITRDRHSEKAKALLSQGVEVVEADLNDLNSLLAAFDGTHSIFAVTNYFDALHRVGAAESIEVESRLGINLAKAAASTASLEHYIWSTLPNSRRVSGGEAVVPYYESKNRVDNYIKNDPVLFNKTTFLWVMNYATNINYPFFQPFAIPNSAPSKLYTVSASPAETLFKQAGDASINVGLFAKAIIEQPEKTLPGKFVLLATDDMTLGGYVDAWARLQGKEAAILQTDKETYYNMWPVWGELMDLSISYWALMKEQGCSGEEVILTKDDLGIEGLVDTQAAFARQLSS